MKIIAIIPLLFSCVFAQNLSITLDKDTILIGDHINLDITIKNTNNDKVLFPVFADSISTFDVINSYPIDTLSDGYNKRYSITQFNAGNYQFGQIPTVVVHSNGVMDTLYSNNVNLVVNTIEVDTTQAIKSIKTVKSLPFPWKEFLKKWGIPLLLLLIALGVLIYYIAKRKKLFVKEEKPKTMLDFYEEALQKLDEIDQKKMWQNDQIKEYYFGISEVMRTYLEGRFGINAMESTTDEIKDELFLETGLKNKVTDILAQADLAKFAKFKPLNDENMSVMKKAKDFVRHTKPKEIKKEDV
ncbi:MAG: hypothetical protein H6578_02285 [Chitinophagales bacterium]|nr:hypothetical protein [Chitinophagales bacterium]